MYFADFGIVGISDPPADIVIIDIAPKREAESCQDAEMDVKRIRQVHSGEIDRDTAIECAQGKCRLQDTILRNDVLRAPLH